MPDRTATPRTADCRRGVPRSAGRLAGAALAAVAATLLAAGPAHAADGGGVAPAATGFAALLALAATATAAGLVLLRPLGAPAPRHLTAAAVTAAVAHLLTLGLGGDAPAAGTLVLAAACLALLPGAPGGARSAYPWLCSCPPGPACWRCPRRQSRRRRPPPDTGSPPRCCWAASPQCSARSRPGGASPTGPRPVMLAAVTAEAAAGAVRLGAGQGALGPEGPGWAGPARWVCLAVAVAGAVGLGAGLRRRRQPDRTLLRGQAVVLPAVVIVAVTATAVVLPAPPGRPGAPLLVAVDNGDRGIPLMVVPQRPGWNLVHVGAEGVSVGLRPDRLSPVTRLPGATNGWSLVHLPPGPSRLHVAYGGRDAVVRLDAGAAGGAGPDLRGPDGPECVSAALGALLRGGSQPLSRCPADALSPGDREDLDATVAFLAPRAEGAVSVVGDSSARSVAAVAAVTAAARRAGLRVVPPGTGRHPTLVVTGWAGAEAALRDAARGPGAAARHLSGALAAHRRGAAPRDRADARAPVRPARGAGVPVRHGAGPPLPRRTRHRLRLPGLAGWLTRRTGPDVRGGSGLAARPGGARRARPVRLPARRHGDRGDRPARLGRDRATARADSR